MLVKLAVRYGLSKRRSVMLICADGHRVAASEPLRTYASIVGVRFAAATNFGELLAELERCRDRDLVLIDTPGFGPAEQPWAEELAGIFAHFDLPTHLVVPAYMNAKSLESCRERLSVFRPESLMLTRLDETEAFGGVISAAITSGLPLSHCGNGQSIPEDMVPANLTLLTEKLFVAEAAKENRSAA
jgi:flagellar biosynthesis protein FlhF